MRLNTKVTLERKIIYTSYYAKLHTKGVLKPFFADKWLVVTSRSIPRWLNKDLRALLDNSFKKAFEPSSGLVWDFKNGNITQERYTNEYSKILDNKLVVNPNIISNFLREIKNDRVPVLLCFEKSGEFCHRLILAGKLIQELKNTNYLFTMLEVL